MDKQSSLYSNLLITAFTEHELASLEKQPHFNTALAAVRSFGEFERMCAIGRRLLVKDSHRPSAPQIQANTAIEIVQ